MGSTNQWVPSPLPAAQTGTAGSEGSIFPSAARTAATYNSDPLYNPGCRGVRIYGDITNANGGTITVKVQTQDPVSKNWVDMTGGTTAAWNANQTKTLTIYPGITAAAGTATTNTEASNDLGPVWRIVVTVATATVTFSIGAEYLL